MNILPFQLSGTELAVTPPSQRLLASPAVYGHRRAPLTYQSLIMESAAAATRISGVRI